MSDVTNKYVNAYIDTSVGMINEYITKYIQVQAQLKVANDIIAEREGIINQLTSEITKIREESAKVNETEFIAMKNKLSHMDTLMQQMGQMKLLIKEKDEEINKLKNQVIDITTKPVINIKRRKEKQAEVKSNLPVLETVNEF
jgi:D-aminopeptidase